MNSVLKAAPKVTNPVVAENDVKLFVARHGLGCHMETALRLIAEHFNGAAASVERVHDQEFADECLSLHINVEGALDAILNDYDAFTRAFVGSVPSDVIGKIRLSLTTAEDV